MLLQGRVDGQSEVHEITTTHILVDYKQQFGGEKIEQIVAEVAVEGWLARRRWRRWRRSGS